jgi:hypothetical protein
LVKSYNDLLSIFHFASVLLFPGNKMKNV